jgi:phosphonate transport system substrate-binding protein
MMLERKVLKKEDIRIIWTSDLIPNPVIAIRSDLPAEMKADLKAMFLGLHKDDPKVFTEVARGESQGYKEVQHSAYQIAVDLRRQLASERRNKK